MGSLGTGIFSTQSATPNIAGPVRVPGKAEEPNFQTLPESQECGGEPQCQRENIPEAGPQLKRFFS